MLFSTLIAKCLASLKADKCSMITRWHNVSEIGLLCYVVVFYYLIKQLRQFSPRLDPKHSMGKHWASGL